MPTYSIAQAKEQLPPLVDEALAGEPVTITRDGEAVVELRARANHRPGRPTPELIADIAAQAKLLPPLWASAAEIVREMRDEER